MGHLNNKKSLKEVRKALRNRPTPEEYDLWQRLKGKQLMGKKFRRQHSFGDFILDFYCPEKKLAVELDGSPHFTKEGNQSDLERDAILDSCGIRVIRFENKEVRENIERVLNEIGTLLGKDDFSRDY
jgi:very-short-patch-repair endonuclease